MIRCQTRKTQRHQPAHYQDPSQWLKDQRLTKIHSTNHSLYIYWRSFWEILQSSKSWICDRLKVNCVKVGFRFNCYSRLEACNCGVTMVANDDNMTKTSYVSVNRFMKRCISLKLRAKRPEGAFIFKACGCHHQCLVGSSSNPRATPGKKSGKPLWNPWGNT